MADFGWVENIKTGGSTVDVGPRRRLLRTYTVWGYPPEQIRDAPESILDANGIPLPRLNDVYDGMALDAYDITSGIGRRVFDVTGKWSNDRSFVVGARIDPTKPGYTDWSGSFAKQNVPIPFARKSRSVVYVPSNVSGEPPTEVVTDGWDFFNSQTPCGFGRFVARCNIQSEGLVGPALDAIDKQKGKLHLIRNRFYLYEGADWARQGLSVWEFRHSWVLDEGIRIIPFWDPGNGEDPPDLVVPMGLDGRGLFEWPPGSNSWWVRAPFHEVVILPSADGTSATWPEFRDVLTADNSDPGGYADLINVELPP